MKLSSSPAWPHLSSSPYSYFLWYLNSCFDLQQNTHAVLEAMPPKDQGIITIAAWINIRMCVCVCLWWGFHGVVFPSTFILCLLFWSLVMWLKSINHQSISQGSLTHELRGRSRGGKCQESFQWTLSISCSDWERRAGSLPTEVLGFGGLCWSCLISLDSLFFSWITSH